MKKNLIIPKENLIKKLSHLIVSTLFLALSSFLVSTTYAHASNGSENPILLTLNCNDNEKEECKIVFNSSSELDKPVAIEEVEVVELEEEVFIDFDTKLYLPLGFNPLKGIHALNWDKIELIEPEYEMDIDYMTEHVSSTINPVNILKSLNWRTIVLHELKKNSQVSFYVNQTSFSVHNASTYLEKQDWNTIILNELNKNSPVSLKTHI